MSVLSFNFLFVASAVMIATFSNAKLLSSEDVGMDNQDLVLETIHDITTNNVGNLCQLNNYRSVRMNIPIEKHGFSEAESKVILAGHLIEDLQAQRNENIIQPILMNILDLQKNVLMVRFLTFSPWLMIWGSNGKTEKENILFQNITMKIDESSFPWYFRRISNLEFLEERFMHFNLSSSGWWTYPYFSCEQKTWLISFAIPIKSAEQKPRSQHSNDFVGILAADVDVSQLDLNQCDLKDGVEQGDPNQILEFAGSHKCHLETSKCDFILGNGWVKGSYHCLCRDGYHGNAGSSYFNGSLVEVAWRDKNDQGSDSYDLLYQCKKCSTGCSTCINDNPCLASYNWTVRYIILSISLVCFVFTILLAFLVYSFRKMRVFKVASPSFLCITLTGCAIMYLEMVAIFPYLDMYFCIVTKWTRHLGFLITYSALLMKTWRVNLTYRVKSAHKLKLTDKQLLQWMLPIILVMLTYLSAWTISDPPQGVFIEDSEGLKFKQCTYGWWDHSLGFGEFLFLMWGIKVCYNVRKARTQFDEARLIRWSIYNIAVVNIIMVTFHLLILPHAGPDTKYFLGFLRTQMGTSVTIVLVFGAKFLRVLRGTANESDDRTRINNVAMLDGPIDREEDMEDTDKEEHKDLEQENEELKEEIQKLAGQIEHMKIVGMLTDNRHIRAKKDGYFTKENLLKQLDYFQPHFTTPNSQQNGGNGLPSKIEQFRRSHSVRTVQSSLSTGEVGKKWSARTMPKSVAALTSKNRKQKSHKDSVSNDIQVEDTEDNLTLIVPEKHQTRIRIQDPETCSLSGSPNPTRSVEQHKLIERCASENNAKDYSLAENINWFLTDSHTDDERNKEDADILGVKRPGVPLILRQQPSVEAQTQFPEIGLTDPGPVLLHPCCAGAKKKSRKKKRLSFRKTGDEDTVRNSDKHEVTNAEDILNKTLQTLSDVIDRSDKPEMTSPETDVAKFSSSGKESCKKLDKVRTHAKARESKNCCKHFPNKFHKNGETSQSEIKTILRTEDSTNQTETEEESIGSHFIPDHVKSLIPERV